MPPSSPVLRTVWLDGQAQLAGAVTRLAQGDAQAIHDARVATRRPTGLTDLTANLPAFDQPLLAEVARRAAPQAQMAAPPAGTPIFTDDRAPVEQVVHALVLRYMLGISPAQ